MNILIQKHTDQFLVEIFSQIEFGQIVLHHQLGDRQRLQNIPQLEYRNIILSSIQIIQNMREGTLQHGVELFHSQSEERQGPSKLRNFIFQFFQGVFVELEQELNVKRVSLVLFSQVVPRDRVENVREIFRA